MYILSLYFCQKLEFLIIQYILAFIFFSIIILKILFSKSFKINKLFLFLTFFFIFAIISSIQAIDIYIALEDLMKFFVVYCVSFAFINYINYRNHYHIIRSFIYSGFLASLFLIFNTIFLNNNLESVLGNRNIISILITISLTLTLFYYFYINRKISYIFLSLPMLWTILFLGSKKGIFIFIGSIIIFLFLETKKTIKSKLKFITYSSLILTIFFILIFKIPTFYNTIGHRVEGLIFTFIDQESVDLSTKYRLTFIKLGISYFKSAPFIGFGLDNYKILLNQSLGFETYSHSNIIELLVDTGIFGFISYYSMFFYILLKNKKNSFQDIKLNKIKNNFLSLFISFTFIGGIALIHYKFVSYYIIMFYLSFLFNLNFSKNI